MGASAFISKNAVCEPQTLIHFSENKLHDPACQLRIKQQKGHIPLTRPFDRPSYKNISYSSS